VTKRRAAAARAGSTRILEARALRTDPPPAGYPIGLHAFAKVNLSLQVGGLRADGYHDVNTVLQTIDLADTLYVRPRASGFRIRVRRSGPARTLGAPVSPGSANLVIRAARAAQAALGRTEGAEFFLVKRIPAGAGLGGGSSNAAATLRALARLWTTSLSVRQRESISAILGSDCAFFVRGGRARATGRGEILRRLDVPAPAPRILLALHRRGVSTREAYRWLDEARAGRLRRFMGRFDLTPQKRNPRIDSRSARSLVGGPERANDFEEVVSSQRREIVVSKQLLREWGGRKPRLSGSGSAVFAELPDRVLPANVVTRRRLLPFTVVLARFTRVGSLWCR
jgi:4-diphosphocytidyl-2-C-methyl-D-erythritol kinase